MKSVTGISAGKYSKVSYERANFKALILSNPNYFGNLKASGFSSVKTIVNDTAFEELKCVGFNPQLSQLEAVVWVKQEFGYLGGLCSEGSSEWVRFYLSYDNGATWHDQQIVSFTAYDVPGNKPLEYTVTLHIDPTKMPCTDENLPKVRAILSWNEAPPPNSPDYVPVWGNVVEARIQVEPYYWPILEKALVQAKVKIPEALKSAIDLTQKVATPKPKALSAVELKALYKGTNVPAHRFLFSEIQKMILTPAIHTPSIPIPPPELKFPPPTTPLPKFKPSLMEIAGVELAAIVVQLLATDGDTSYEELGCIGLDPNWQALSGILKVKLPNGYSGNLCSPGSQEYVAFWVDWGDGAGWTWVGTASVNVHDVASIPPEGLEYAVFQPVDVASHRQPCNQGPKTAKVRAILSWEIQPPSWNPDYVPTWGNRLETLVLIPPGKLITPGTPDIFAIGGINLAGIDVFGSGMTIAGSPQARFWNGAPADDSLLARSCPFGGRVMVNGAPSIGFKYRVVARKFGKPSTQLNMADQIWTVNTITHAGTWQTPDSDGMFDYLSTTDNAYQTLASWTFGGDELWEIRLEVYDAMKHFIAATPWYRVQMDNTAPSVEIHIDSGGDCKDFPASTIINGHFVAQDANFGHYNMYVEPQSLPPGTFTAPPPAPTSSIAHPGYTQTAAPPGDTWTLDTTGMQPCGYVVRVDVADRSIVGSTYALHNWNHDAVGFCLRK